MRSALSGRTSSEVGYGELIRTNASFRWLWIGTVVSLLGDWFNTIAIYELVNELTEQVVTACRHEVGRASLLQLVDRIAAPEERVRYRLELIDGSAPSPD